MATTEAPQVDRLIRQFEEGTERPFLCFIFSDLSDSEIIGHAPLIGYTEKLTDPSPKVMSDDERTDWRFFPKQDIDLVAVNLKPNSYRLPNDGYRPDPKPRDYEVGFISNKVLEDLSYFGQRGWIQFKLENEAVRCSYPFTYMIDFSKFIPGRHVQSEPKPIERQIPLTRYDENTWAYLSDSEQDWQMRKAWTYGYLKGFPEVYRTKEDRVTKTSEANDSNTALREYVERGSAVSLWSDFSFKFLDLLVRDLGNPDEAKKFIATADRTLFYFNGFQAETLTRAVRLAKQFLRRGASRRFLSLLNELNERTKYYDVVEKAFWLFEDINKEKLKVRGSIEGAKPEIRTFKNEFSEILKIMADLDEPDSLDILQEVFAAVANLKKPYINKINGAYGLFDPREFSSSPQAKKPASY